jgi:hypothetical protein
MCGVDLESSGVEEAFSVDMVVPLFFTVFADVVGEEQPIHV